METIQFNVEIPKNIAKQVKRDALDLDITYNEWATAAFEHYLKVRGVINSTDAAIVKEFSSAKEKPERVKPAAKRRQTPPRTSSL